MIIRKTVVLALSAGSLLGATAEAQFRWPLPSPEPRQGQPSDVQQPVPGEGMPKDDFTWHWGDPSLEGRKDHISVYGREAGHACSLRAKLTDAVEFPRRTLLDVALDLKDNEFFVRYAAYYMYQGQRAGIIEWATLTCVEEPTAKEQRLRGRAERAQERRREDSADEETQARAD